VFDSGKKKIVADSATPALNPLEQQQQQR